MGPRSCFVNRSFSLVSQNPFQLLDAQAIEKGTKCKMAVILHLMVVKIFNEVTTASTRSTAEK